GTGLRMMQAIAPPAEPPEARPSGQRLRQGRSGPARFHPAAHTSQAAPRKQVAGATIGDFVAVQKSWRHQYDYPVAPDDSAVIGMPSHVLAPGRAGRGMEHQGIEIHSAAMSRRSNEIPGEG